MVTSKTHSYLKSDSLNRAAGYTHNPMGRRGKAVSPVSKGRR